MKMIIKKEEIVVAIHTDPFHSTSTSLFALSVQLHRFPFVLSVLWTSSYLCLSMRFKTQQTILWL